jgi:phage terminase small subunit
MSRRASRRAKELRGTLRASRDRPAASSPVLSEWPAAPRGLSPAEREAWTRLGASLLPLGTVGTADLELVRLAATALAHAGAAARDPATKPTARTAAVRLAADLLHRLGLGPLARAQVEPVTDPRGPAQRIMDEIRGVR